MNKKSSFTPSNAEKAFIYQQTEELASSFEELGAISVLLEKQPESSNYIITFMLNSSIMNILAQSEGKDLSETCISAKNQMKKKLSLLTESLNHSPKREKLIEELKKSPYIH